MSSRDEIVKALYLRLEDLRFVLKNSKPKDSFDEGINFAMAHEESWLSELLDLIERS
jgi:hypothetical protein